MIRGPSSSYTVIHVYLLDRGLVAMFVFLPSLRFPDSIMTMHHFTTTGKKKKFKMNFKHTPKPPKHFFKRQKCCKSEK